MDKKILDTIICGNSVDVIKSIGADQIDAIVTDPPYGIKYDCDLNRFTNDLAPGTSSGKFREIHGDEEFSPGPWLDFPKVVMFGANCFSNKLPIGSWLIWLKKRDSMLNTFLADAEIAWMKSGHGIYMFKHEWAGMLKDSERGEKRLHPTQKPVVVMEWVMNMAKIPEGAIVLDPYCGSGSTAIACIRTNRHFIGIDIDQDYVDKANVRIQNELSQMSLF